MKIFILIIVLLMVAIVIAFLVSRLLDSLKIIRQLRKDRNDLIKERAAQLDQLRQKGIDIDELKKELAKYSEVEIKVALTLQEKWMILNALNMPHYKGMLENPATKYIKREIYRILKEKIKESIKE